MPANNLRVFWKSFGAVRLGTVSILCVSSGLFVLTLKLILGRETSSDPPPLPA